MTTSWRAWLPDAGLAAVVSILGIFEVAPLGTGEASLALLLVAAGTGVAAGLSRHQPAAALGLTWTVCALQVVTGAPILVVQLAIAVVAFGTARWGSTAVVWAGALSIPVAFLIAVEVAHRQLYYLLVSVIGYPGVINNAHRLSETPRVGAALAGTALLGTPWLAGLAVRFGASARASLRSQAAAEQDALRAGQEKDQAREIARLREEQTRMARDVHDVVGHSLAVILAQAESAQYLAGDDDLQRTMATIATSARASLRDVRQVLASTDGRTPEVPPRGLDNLIEGARASGHEIISRELGRPQPLPPELDTVAFRVLQEMLTNAIRHGRRDTAVSVERRWRDDLTIEVRNAVDASVPRSSGGQGLDGMRRRLDAVGGRLDVRAGPGEGHGEGTGEPGESAFTVTARLPARAVAP